MCIEEILTFLFVVVVHGARIGLKVASEEAAGVLSQVKISGHVKYVMGQTLELQLLIIHDLSPKINIIG